MIIFVLCFIIKSFMKMKIKEHEIIVIVLSLTKISIIFKHKRHLYKFV